MVWRTVIVLALFLGLSCGNGKSDSGTDSSPTRKKKKAVKKQESKTTQCNRLIQIINTEQEVVKSSTGADSAALRTLANKLDGVAIKVSTVKLTDEKLIAFRDSYTKMASDLAASSRKVADAVDAVDRDALTEGTKAMQSFGTRESKIVGDLNVYCTGSE